MRRMCRTGATLLLGAGTGASVSRLLSSTHGPEEEGGAGLLSSTHGPEEEGGAGLLSSTHGPEEEGGAGLLSSTHGPEEEDGAGLLSSTHGPEEEDGAGLLSALPVVPVPTVQAAELTVSPGGSGAVMKYGFPSLANIKTRDSYVTSYDPRTRTASWVIERLNPASLSGPSDRKYCEFREDDSVHVFHRATNADYKGSGFDRGHLAAAANHKWSQKAMDDTFYLSNVAPQNPHLNQNTWNNLEKMCRSLTKRYLNVYVCTGPLYLPRQEADGKFYVRYQVLGRNHVAVPTHFFKVLILEQPDGRGVELRSYVLPNEPIDEKVPLERFLVPIETIERASGLLFVPNVMKRTSSLKAIADR